MGGLLRRRDVEMDLVLRFRSHLKVPRRRSKDEDVLDATIDANPAPLRICQNSARKVDEVGVLVAGQFENTQVYRHRRECRCIDMTCTDAQPHHGMRENRCAGYTKFLNDGSRSIDLQIGPAHNVVRSVLARSDN